MTTREVLRDLDVRRLWVGMTAGRLGTSVSQVAMPLVALEVLDANAFVVSLLTAFHWLPWLVIGLPAGVWVDRLPKRGTMLVCDAVCVLALVSVPVAVWTDRLTVAHLLGVSLVVGISTVFFQAAWTVYLPQLVRREALVPANALLHGSDAAVQVVGPGIAGVLAGAAGAAAGVLLDAVSYLVSGICLLRVRRKAPAREPVVRRRLRAEMAEGLAFVLRDAVLLRLVLHGAVSNMALTGYYALLVVLLVRDVGLSAPAVGVLLAATGIGGVIGASGTQALVRRVGSARALVICKAGAGPCALLIPFVDTGVRLLLFVAGTVLVTGLVIAGNVVASAFRQAYVPSALLGRVTTTMQFANLGTVPLGAVIGGAVATATSTRTAVATLAIVFAVSGLLLVLGPLRGLRDLPTSPPDERALGRWQAV